MNSTISVIIAAYNEEKTLHICLDSLEKQKYPKDKYEVIVVDNGSNDNTSSIAKKFTAKVFYYDKIQGCGAAKKFGAEKAKSSIIAIIDADSMAEPDWLEKIDFFFQDRSTICVGGPVVPYEKNIWTKCVFQLYNGLFLINHLLGKPILWGLNMAVKKTAYEEVGGFNEDLLGSDDWELIMRLKKKFTAKQIKYEQSMSVITSTRKQNSPKAFWQYTLDGVKNYYAVVIMKKPRSAPIFNVR